MDTITGRRDVPVTIVGSEWDDETVDAMRKDLVRLAQLGGRPVHHVHLRLDHLANRSVKRPFCASVTLDVDGYPIHARAEGCTAEQAAFVLRRRVRAQLEHLSERHWWSRRNGSVGTMLHRRPALPPRHRSGDEGDK